MIIHLDMDGVLVDFHRGFLALSGLDYTTMSSNAFWREAVKHQDMYKNLPKMHDADWLVDRIIDFTKMDIEIYIEILTALPSLAQFPNAEKHKREWIEKQGWKFKFKVGPFAVDKQLHTKPGDILIDDKLRNIDQWNKAGGIGIHHITAKDTVRRLGEVLHDGS